MQRTGTEPWRHHFRRRRHGQLGDLFGGQQPVHLDLSADAFMSSKVCDCLPDATFRRSKDVAA